MKSLICLVIVLALRAEAGEWRTYAGGFGSRWNTTGHHGHDQDGCELPDCDAVDFTRANLDDSIGFRVGRERDLWTFGILHAVAGADASVSHTEYNLSQRDFALVSTALFAGLDVEFRGFRIGARYGGGGYIAAAAEQRGLLRFTELSATLPLRGGAAVRVSKRNFALTRMEASPSRDLAVTIVAADDAEGKSKWDFAAATGTTMPGAGAGGDRKLRQTALNRTTALRVLGDSDLQLEVSWSSTAHESSLPSIFRGYGGNFRSKTIEGYGLALSRTRPLTERLSLRWSAGFEVADWRDEHRLLTRDGAELVAGVEIAAAASAALRVQLRPRLALESSLQKLYWRGIDLGEARCTFGIVLTR